MQRGFCSFIAVCTILAAVEVSLSSDLRPGKQNTLVISQNKTPPAKLKSQKSQESSVTEKKNSVSPQKDTVSKKPKRPVIKLESPRDGLEVRGYDGIMLEGTVDDPDIKKVTLLLNGIPVPIKVQDGRFSRKIFLPGRFSTFKMMARNKSGTIGYSDLHKVLYFKESNTQSSNTVGVVPHIEHLIQKDTPKDTDAKDKRR